MYDLLLLARAHAASTSVSGQAQRSHVLEAYDAGSSSVAAAEEPMTQDVRSGLHVGQLRPATMMQIGRTTPFAAWWRRHGALILIGLLLLASRVSAQDSEVEIWVAPPEQIQELVLTDASVLYGRVVDAGDPFRFVLVSGVESVIAVENVRSLREAAGSVEGGEFWPEDPNRTRLFFGPTARSLARGEGYFAVYELFVPFLTVGITDSFIISGGTPLIFGEEGSRPFWLAPKLRVLQSGNTEAAVGVLGVTIEDENFGLLYGVVTRGTPTGSFTVGVGYGYANGGVADNPAIMLGGEIRAGRRVKLITENYLFPGSTGLISIGPRFFGERLSADLGLVVPVGAEDTIVFPLVNFVWNF